MKKNNKICNKMQMKLNKIKKNLIYLKLKLPKIKKSQN